MDDPDDKMIEQLLEDVARAKSPDLSDELLARIVTNAEPVVERALVAATGLRGLLAALGGWPAMGGLVAAGVAGLWIGVSPATGLDGLVAGVLGDDMNVDLLAGADVLSWEIEG